MQFRSKLQYYLVKKLGKSNKEILAFIENGSVRINQTVVTQNIFIGETDDIELNGELIRKGVLYEYILYNKPRGIETTLNPAIENNLHSVLKLGTGFYHIGRLDKDSEGLLLLCNDGSLGKSLLHKDKGITKIYEVEVDKDLTEEFLSFLENGVVIMGKTTIKCKTFRTGEKTFEIHLTEGMNRQIRRMCYKAGYTVLRLLRKEFAGIKLDIEPGAHRYLEASEIKHLRSF